jgi:hypothetical protein
MAKMKSDLSGYIRNQERKKAYFFLDVFKFLGDKIFLTFFERSDIQGFAKNHLNYQMQ